MVVCQSKVTLDSIVLTTELVAVCEHWFCHLCEICGKIWKTKRDLMKHLLPGLSPRSQLFNYSAVSIAPNILNLVSHGIFILVQDNASQGCQLWFQNRGGEMTYNCLRVWWKFVCQDQNQLTRCRFGWSNKYLAWMRLYWLCSIISQNSNEENL